MAVEDDEEDDDMEVSDSPEDAITGEVLAKGEAGFMRGEGTSALYSPPSPPERGGTGEETTEEGDACSSKA